ncbi:hypothetical protein [Streptomyces atroolivaceus]|uniref:hypothetical protein n=1 Tax=Streptomyces atroolivaceus TaxID=66869 RepID=UPI00362F97D0
MTEIVYDNLPDGPFTALTYGLPLAEHPDWQHGSPELCLSVNSTNVIWAHAVGFLAEQLRGTCPFSYGRRAARYSELERVSGQGSGWT